MVEGEGRSGGAVNWAAGGGEWLVIVFGRCWSKCLFVGGAAYTAADGRGLEESSLSAKQAGCRGYAGGLWEKEEGWSARA